jgi:hypothetical protein
MQDTILSPRHRARSGLIYQIYLLQVLVYNETPKNKLEKYLISGGTVWESTSADFLLF